MPGLKWGGGVREIEVLGAWCYNFKLYFSQNAIVSIKLHCTHISDYLENDQILYIFISAEFPIHLQWTK